MTPTARTLQRLRELGYTAELVEQKIRIPGGRMFKRDLFGVGDIVAIRPGDPALLIQASTRAHHAERRAKAAAEPRLLIWLATGNKFEVWTWDKRRASGSKRQTWQALREELTGVQVVNERAEKAQEDEMEQARLALHGAVMG